MHHSMISIYFHKADYLYQILYRIVGKFGERKLWQINKSVKRLIVSTNLDGLFWQIMDNLPSLPNIRSAKHFR